MNCDVLIRGARVVDGTGNPWFFADVALMGDRIAAIAPPGHLNAEAAGEVIEAHGKVFCPGFIDIQSHSLMPLYSDGRSLSKVTQGVTTEILGELWTPAPLGGRRDLVRSAGDIATDLREIAQKWRRFSDWLSSYEQIGVSVNVGSFVGGGTVREWACGWDAGDPTPEQMEEMRRVTAEAMEDGAFGIAPALIYPPSSYSPDSELTECAKVVGRYGGVYIVHLRSEGDGLLDAIEATITLSREADCPVEIYHLKASGERNWPRMADAIERIHAARADGVDITADMYPYVASGTGLSVLIPLWASEGGRMWENLGDPATRRRIHDEMIAPGAATGDFANTNRGDHVMPLGFKKEENRGYIGRTLTDIAEERGQDWADAAIDLLLAEGQRIATVFFSMSEDNLRLQFAQPWVKISTDAGGLDPATQTNPVHPRGYGTYPRVLGKYVREEKILTLEDAVRKMTSAVADRLRLKGRGLLREGYFADVVLFDAATIADRATFTHPHQLSIGIEQVWVNGARVIQDSQHTGAKPGRLVYGAGK
jgi:N-acyl-D-aspartate/D-glutamate deacylase